MHIVFCDDDPFALQQLQQAVADFFDAQPGKKPTLAAYGCGADLLRSETQVDIAFLDVEMPDMDGISVGARLKQANPHVKIFIVTSFTDYLDEAMRNQVYRYLFKPVDTARLYRNLKDAVRQYNQDTRELAVETAAGVVCVRAHEIIYVEATGHKTTVHTTGGSYLSVDGIKEWGQKLALPSFYTPYRGFVINMRYVSSFGRDSICLASGSRRFSVYLARRKYTDFKETFLLYQEGVH